MNWNLWYILIVVVFFVGVLFWFFDFGEFVIGGKSYCENWYLEYELESYELCGFGFFQ